MIAYLNGKVIKKKLDSAVIEVNGVGYLVYMPLSTLTKLEIGETVELNIHPVVRDNFYELYGFISEEELFLFSKLIKVPKVGAKLACMILSGLSIEKLIKSIENRDIALLSSIPGIGKKTAERICVDLKGKLTDVIEREKITDLSKDLASALINLGFKKSEIKDIVNEVIKEYPDESIENLLKIALGKIYDENL